MVRLVFRPYTQIWRSICTSEPLRASTRVSSGFTLFRHSSPSFGSQHICSYSRRGSNNLARSMVHQKDPTFSLSLRTRVYHPNTRIYVRLLGPCFKTGRLKPFRQHPKRWCAEAKNAAVLSPAWSMTRGIPGGRPIAFCSKPNWCWLAARKYTPMNRGWIPASNTGFKRFPFDNFTYCLTLFSKFFSSFPHGTCSLSVSRQYLALEGIYLPFWSAFPNKPTLGKRITKPSDWSKTGFSPSMMSCSKELVPTVQQKTLL